ncbi:GL11993 [Drosophila persimilis]|uniref:GL11993 n=1 Tax=Drosophila persimilis TaxID=7234 RepID=B4GLP7_DROPE|nr:GL11993 [Drosophila persimilis]
MAPVLTGHHRAFMPLAASSRDNSIPRANAPTREGPTKPWKHETKAHFPLNQSISQGAYNAAFCSMGRTFCDQKNAVSNAKMLKALGDSSGI